MTLTGASLGETSDAAATINLALRLQNPNNDPLELLEFDYRVDVDGKRVYSGKRAAQMTLARLATRDVVLPAVVPFDVVGGGWGAGAAPPSANVRVQGTLRYIAPGAIEQTLFDTGVRRPSASFSGEQPLQASPEAAAAPATQAP